MGSPADPATAMKARAAQQAAALVEDGMLVGLGSGSTSALMVQALAERAREGLRFTGVPTSEATVELATRLGLRLTSLDDQPHLDLTLDGADEVDPRLNVIKGGGGALLREKIVAGAARRLVLIVDHTKLVDHLGRRWALPVEIVPFGWTVTAAALTALGARPVRRTHDDGAPFVTDGGHYILDCRFDPFPEPEPLATRIKSLVGVVEHGMFLGMAEAVVVGYPDRVEVLRR